MPDIVLRDPYPYIFHKAPFIPDNRLKPCRNCDSYAGRNFKGQHVCALQRDIITPLANSLYYLEGEENIKIEKDLTFYQALMEFARRLDLQTISYIKARGIEVPEDCYFFYTHPSEEVLASERKYMQKHSGNK